MLLTYEAASGQVQLVPARSHPDSSAVGADQAGLALGVLGQEGHHPLHWPPAGRGHALRSLQQSLKQAALVEDHVVRDTDLERKRHSETSWQRDRTVTPPTCHQWSSSPCGREERTPVLNHRPPLESSAQDVPPSARATHISSRPWASLDKHTEHSVSMTVLTK